MISSKDEIMWGGHDLQIFLLRFVLEFSKDPPGSLPVDRKDLYEIPKDLYENPKDS